MADPNLQDAQALQHERVRPDDATIAFAMAIVSSKPPELTVREYILILRQHVSKGRRENALSSAYRHLDTSSYWRAECERLKEILLAAETRTTDARRQAEVSKAKLEIFKAASNTGAAKKKRANPDVIPYPRSPKKARRDVSPSREVPVSRMLEDDALFEDMGDRGQELMQALFRINACLKPGERSEAIPLAQPLINASKEVSNVVNQAIDRQLAAQDTDSSALLAAFTACTRVITIMLLGFTRLSRADDAATVRGQVTYAFVHMFERLVANIRKISSAETTQKALTSTTNSSARPSTAAKHDKPKASRRVNIQDCPLLNTFTSFLANILRQLDAKRESHLDLFEGFLFVILARLGSNVHVLNFDRTRPATLEEEIASGPTSDAVVPNAADSEAIQASKIEAPFMLHLLKAGLAQAPAFLSPNNTAKSSKAKAAPKPGSVTKASLAIAAKERLQRSLVNAIFGTEGLDEESDMFLDCLKKPVVAGTVTIHRVKEADVGEWFREEVWRLLGWEVVARELEE